MYHIVYTSAFKKDFKRFLYNSKIVTRFTLVVDILASGQSLPDNFRDHKLKGEFGECRECHIFPDVLLIYKIDKGKLQLLLIRMGSHSELFG